jgi:nifR3 family TIM-barrel protein
MTETTGAAQGSPRTLKIGPIALDPPVVLAPMAGVTNASFRQLCRSYGAGLYVSEMITARALVEGNPRTSAMLPGPDEPVRSVQLYGVDPAVIGAAVRRLVDEIGVDHIDLNFGCPAAKVTRKGGGAALPLHRVLFRNVVRAALAAAGSVPVTVKMRIGIDDAHRSAVPAARIAVDEGVAAVALHARTAVQHYAGQADWSAIAELKAAIDGVPVLGNGDIWEATDATAMMAATGCDGVVIGRGCLGRPWLFADLVTEFHGGTPADPPPLGVAIKVMSAHARALIEEMGPERGIRQMRKHTGWYLAGYPVGGTVRQGFAQVSSLARLDQLIDELDPDLALPDAARRLPRGHTNGPIPVTLPVGWLDDLDDPTPPQGADSFVSGG